MIRGSYRRSTCLVPATRLNQYLFVSSETLLVTIQQPIHSRCASDLAMRDPLRSKTGCWTCRMRKKKCDETRPRCAACESLSITCHGFGPKPQWMDDDEERRAFLQTTREASRRKLRQRISPQDSSQVTRNLRPAVKSNDANDDLPLTRSSSATSRHQDQAPADQMPSTAVVKMASTVSMSPSIQTCVSERHQNPITKHQNEDGHETERHLLSLSPGDFDLLMHFLDRVFVQQYPVYHPPVAESGRGWLLSDLLSTAALYHSALALSASHQRILGTEGMSDSRKMISMKLQEDHFAACMKLIHLSAKNNCPGSGAGRIGIGTAVLQLLFFEVFTPNTFASTKYMLTNKRSSGQDLVKRGKFILTCWQKCITISMRMILQILDCQRELGQCYSLGSLPQMMISRRWRRSLPLGSLAALFYGWTSSHLSQAA